MEPRQLDVLPAELFRELYLLCLRYPPRITDSRKNSGPGRTQAYGIINRVKGGRGIGLGMNCEKYPKIWDQGQKLAQAILPDSIKWTTFMLNMNYEAQAHVDKNNDGESLVVAFGDYTGGELVIRNSDGTDTEFNIRYRPVIMDASKITHYVKPVTSGTRYSIIFFRTSFHKKFYAKYGETLDLYDLIDLLPEKLPGQKNSELKIPV
jgi:hypothetical protein